MMRMSATSALLAHLAEARLLEVEVEVAPASFSTGSANAAASETAPRIPIQAMIAIEARGPNVNGGWVGSGSNRPAAKCPG
jgi:hypothetical protein